VKLTDSGSKTKSSWRWRFWRWLRRLRRVQFSSSWMGSWNCGW